MKILKKSLFFIFLLCFLFIISSCNNKNKLVVKDLSINHELEFGGVYVEITIEDFNKLGFEYGDSVDVSFSNGYKVYDLPYFNGYYVDAGEALLVGYPGYDFIKVTLNYGDDYWNIADLKENDKASISLNEKNKYLDIQQTMNIQYKDERKEYTSDAEFANYREINVGNIMNNFLYRGASPCDNKHKRAPYVDKLIEADNINFILNLADTKEKIDSYINASDFASPYFLSLYRREMVLLSATQEKVVPVSMNMNYKSNEFRTKLVEGFKNMLYANGPYYIHCQEGKDRTGFVCIVIEALCGASYQELVDDYMYTYYNYYKITKETEPVKYNVLKTRNVDTMLKYLINDENADLEKVDFVPHIKSYLIDGGMETGEVEALINILTK